MGDLVLLRECRLIDFLKINGPSATRVVADHMGWSVERAREELDRLEYRHRIQSRARAPVSMEGFDRLWAAID